jgi:hypothetical protein
VTGVLEVHRFRGVRIDSHGAFARHVHELPRRHRKLLAVLLDPDRRLLGAQRFSNQAGERMLYIDDRTYLEIADVLGISETNVATKISRLKQRLRSELAPSA